MSVFKQRVLTVIQHIEFGTVASYGQVATIAGIPRAARQVGWILNRSEGKQDLPWWRVINNQGRISIKGTRYNTPDLQRSLLRAENITVADDFTLDIEKYRFRPSHDLLKTLSLQPEYLETLIQRYTL